MVSDPAAPTTDPARKCPGKPFAFISYRQKDALPHARSIHEQIESAFGPGAAFLDFRSIAPGKKWQDENGGAYEKATVMLAVVGPGWLESFGRPESARTGRDWVLEEL